MRLDRGLYGLLCSLVMVASMQPVRAAGFDCDRASDAVEKTICASPKLSALDTRLSSVYAAALVRDPARADAIRRDERNWLGERDRRAWPGLSNPQISPDSVAGLLERLYAHRIEFLRNLDTPEDVRGSPVAQTLLAASPLLPKGMTEVLTGLQSSGLVVLSQVRYFNNVSALIKALPASPAPPLQNALQRYAGHPYTALVYLPSVGLGAVYNLLTTPIGSLCNYWVVFETRDGTTRDVGTPADRPGKCWNSLGLGHLALIDGYPVVIVQQDGNTSQDVYLRWRRWWHGKWGFPMQIHVRLDRALKIGTAACDPSIDCDAVRDAALKYARRYDLRPLPLTLADVETLPSDERVGYRHMETFAENADQKWAVLYDGTDARKRKKARESDIVRTLPRIGEQALFCGNEFEPGASFFPARLGGRLVLGRIGPCSSGWRLNVDWMIGFWRFEGSKLVPLGGVVVDRVTGRALLAARVTLQPEELPTP